MEIPVKESERIVLGGIFLEPELLDELSSWLQPEFFSDTNYAHIFRISIKIYQAHNYLDPSILKQELESEQLFEAIGGESTLTSILQAVGPHSDVGVHAHYVVKAYKRRFLQKMGMEIQRKMTHGEEPEMVIKETESELESLMGKGGQSGLEAASTIADRVLIKVDEQAKRVKEGKLAGLDTGFKAINQVTGGLHPGRFNYSCRQTSNGQNRIGLKYCQ